MKQQTRIKPFQFSIIVSLFCMLISSCEVSSVDQENAPKINFWYGDTQSFGQQGNPQNWINIVGNLSQTGVSNVKSLVEGTYSLNGEAAKSFAIGEDNNRLVNDGDFNIGIDHNRLREGGNTVKVSVFLKENGAELISKDVTVNYASGNTWPFPYTADWGQITDIQNVNRVAQVVDGLWELDSEGIRVVSGHEGYDLTIAIGDETWPTDYEVTVPFTLLSNSFRGIGFAFGWQGHIGSESPPIQWPLQALAWVRSSNELEIVTYDGPKRPGGGGWEKSEIRQPLASPLKKEKYFIKARSKSIQNTNLSRIHVKFWAETENEPDAWMISADVPTRKGSVLLVAYDVEVSFGNVIVDALDGVNPPDIAPPIISNFSNVTSDTTAVISWDTNEASDSKVDYGFNTNYQTSESDETLVINHKVTLNDLVPNSQYNFRVTSVDQTGQATSSGNLLFSTTNNGSGSSGLVSDDFGGTLNSDIWEVYDPLAGSVFSMTSTQFKISVPEGTTHNLWKNALDAPRIRQTVIDTDFQVEVKFDSSVSAKYQMQGITVEQDNNNLLRFDFFSDGTKTYLFYASFVNGAPAVTKEIDIEIGTPSYLRVKRSGNQWSISYSVDGLNWVDAGFYNHNLIAGKIGVFAGNVGNSASPAPKHIALVDYFHVTEADGSVSPTDPGTNPNPNPNPSNAVSDEFDDLDTAIWNTYAPLGDGSVASINSQVHINVPEGTRHDLWTNNLNAPRITQQISNTDFEIETKFDSTVTTKYQMQGILVEEDHNNLLRFEFHHDGATTRVFAASIVNGQANQKLSEAIATTGAPLFLKVTRAGNQWTMSYSDDGTNWTDAGSFNHNIAVSTAGLFAGNSGSPAPAHTAVVDYFRVSGLPAPADPNPNPTDPGTNPNPSPNPNSGVTDEFDGLDTAIWSTYAPLGDGSVTSINSQVHINVPEGTRHDLWTNNLNAPRITQQISNTDFEIETKFDSTVTAKYQMQGIIVEDDHNNLLRFEFHHDGATTRVFAASIVNGQANQKLSEAITTTGAPLFLKVTRAGNVWTTSYSNDGTNWVDAGSFNHNITVNTAGLFAGNSGSPAPAHTAVVDYFRVSGLPAPDPADPNPTDPGTNPNPNNAVSDEFDGLDTAIWSTYAPLGDGSVTSINSQVHINVPEGTRHDLWTGNLNAPRITQQISNTDFEIETKFDSTVTTKYQMQGIVVEEDHNNLLRFEFHHDGATTRVFAANIVNGQANQKLSEAITTTGAPLFLKVTRAGNQWTMSYSNDGTNWTDAGSFNHSIAVSTAGLFVGNSGSPAPTHTAVVDYFKLTSQ